MFSPKDKFANFETWDKGNLDMSQAKTPDMLEFEYARAALKNGLKLEDQLGANPYKFGLVGSTNAHTALATADDDNFFGKTTPYEPRNPRETHPFRSPKPGLHGMGNDSVATPRYGRQRTQANPSSMP